MNRLVRGVWASVWASVCVLCALTAGARAAHAQGFHAAATKDGVSAWAVGDSGRVWTTLDGGASWLPGVVGAVAWRAVDANAFTVLLAGDSARILRSADAGGTWSGGALAGAGTTRWRALARGSATRVFACGDGGRIARSDDDGATWSLQVSGSVQALRALAFRDSLQGWACGDAGVLLATSDAGAHWASVSLPTARALLAAAAHGAEVWVGGEAGACFHSRDAGASFAAYDLKAGEQPDVRALAATSTGALVLAGGGGFVRVSADDGATWSFITHPLLASIAALGVAANGAGGVAVSELVRVPVMGALTGPAPGPWSLPVGATVTTSWAKVLALPTQTTNVRGNTLAVHPRDRHILYNMLGSTLFRSPDEGEHWNVVSNLSSVSRVNELLISPKDTAVFVIAAVSAGGARQIMRCTDGGFTWTTTLTHAFGEYGTPIERHPLKPDTLYFGGENDTLMRSLDFGLTWRHFGAGVFRSPCDLAMLADSGEVLLVADGVTNLGLVDFWRSSDAGATFVRTQAGSSSEAPAIALSRLRPRRAYVTSWSGIGARDSDDLGATWPLCPDLNRTGQNVSQTWGVDVAHDDPGVVWVGTFAGGRAYLSLNGGATFNPTTLPNPNYSMVARDRSTVFAQQGDGLYKLRIATAMPWAGSGQSVQLTAPNGGETWTPGSSQAITWNANGIALARIEWRPSPLAPWQMVALADGYRGTFKWTVPAQFTDAAESRVSDAWDAAPLDAADAPFAIHGPLLSCADAPADLGVANLPAGGYGTFTLRNDGDRALHVSAVTSDRFTFVPARTTFTVPAASCDTLGVRFVPAGAGPDSAMLIVASDAGGAPLALRMRASASAAVGMADPPSLTFALAPPAPDPVRAGAATRLRFELPRAARVTLEVFSLQGQRIATLLDGDRPAGRHEVAFMPEPARAAGVYFVRLRAGSASLARRVLVLR